MGPVLNKGQGEHGGGGNKELSLLSISKRCWTTTENHGHCSLVRKLRK